MQRQFQCRLLHYFDASTHRVLAREGIIAARPICSCARGTWLCILELHALSVLFNDAYHAGTRVRHELQVADTTHKLSAFCKGDDSSVLCLEIVILRMVCNSRCVWSGNFDISTPSLPLDTYNALHNGKMLNDVKIK